MAKMQENFILIRLFIKSMSQTRPTLRILDIFNDVEKQF